MLRPKSNIFLIARTKDGKTTLSKFLVEEFGFSTVSASKWVVSTFLAENPYESDPEEYSRKISAFSLEKLRENPNACLDVVASEPEVLAGHCLIEGVRNPRDFASLFDPRKDFVIRFEVESNKGDYSNFESKGLQAIDAILDWYTTCDLVDELQVMRFRLAARENGVSLPIVANGEIPCRDLKEMVDILRKTFVLQGNSNAASC